MRDPLDITVVVRDDYALTYLPQWIEQAAMSFDAQPIGRAIVGP